MQRFQADDSVPTHCRSAARAPRSTKGITALCAAFFFAAASGNARSTSQTSGNSQQSFVAGEAVAALELEVPGASSFILRGTLPLPKGVYPLADGSSPFAIRDLDGVESPAQVEIVSRYPADADGADVVEVLARVARPEGVPQGERIRYEVIWSPHPREDVHVHPDVQKVLGQPNSILLRSRDVFGNVYTADPLRDLREETNELRLLRNGAFALQVRTHETLMPVQPHDGGLGTLPHFLGAHTFVTLWDGEPFLSFDLRIHNGHDGLDPSDPTDDPLAKVYFRKLELIVPQGWMVLQDFEDPMFGSPYSEGNYRVWPLVKPMPDGTLHMIPAQAQFHRRLIIARDDAEQRARMQLEERVLGFCRPGFSATGRRYFSWWNHTTARYFPQKQALPQLWNLGEDYLRQELEDEFRIYEDVLLQGLDGPFPVIVPNLGWAHPWGIKIGYAHGGQEIHLYDGVKTAYAASTPGYRYFQLVHRMSTERHPVALFDGNGDAFAMEDWIVQGPNGPYVPVYMWLWPVLYLADPFGFGDAPTFQQLAVEALGLKPPYESTLLQFEPNDRAHLIRYTRAPKVLAWLGNDALSKDDLRMQAELLRISYTRLPQNWNGDCIVTGMLSDIRDVEANPGQGFAVNREDGWGIDAITAAYCLAGPIWRAKVRPWYYELVELFQSGTCTCTGIIQGDPNLDTFHGDYRSRQSISAAIIENALWGALKSVLEDQDPDATERLIHVLRADLQAMISYPVWNEAANAPWFYVAVGPYNLTLPAFCSNFPDDGFLDVDAYQTWSSFAYGYELTADPLFLQRAAAMLGQPLTTPHLADPFPGFIENRVALLSLVQQLLE